MEISNMDLSVSDYAKLIINQMEDINAMVNNIDSNSHKQFELYSNEHSMVYESVFNSTVDVPNFSNNSISYVVEDNGDGEIINVAAYEEIGEVNSDTTESIEQYSLSDIISEMSTNTEYLAILDKQSNHITDYIQTNHPNPPTSDNEVTSVDTIDNGTYSLITHKPVHVPYTMLSGSPLHLFNVIHLDESTDFTHNFQNRSAVYYGKYPYNYSGISHPPRPFSDNHYLLNIISYMKIVMPGLKFNSALLNKYNDGTSCMPPHSDSEHEIDPDSQIVTISFGATRTMEFINTANQSVSLVKLSHGDVMIMDKASQSYYTHAIHPESCSQTRISVTLRNISPPDQAITPHRPPPLECDNSTITKFLIELNEHQDTHQGYEYQDQHHDVYNNQYQEEHLHRDGYQVGYHKPTLRPNLREPNYKNMPQQHTQNKELTDNNTQNTIYISSSMFRGLDRSKMSSKDQTADVFFYPGADAHRMLLRLKADQRFQSLMRTSITKIFLLTGSNNIDSIYYGSKSLQPAYNDISDLVTYLQQRFPQTEINILNILPRQTKGRNDVIAAINSHIKSLCERSASQQLKYIDTISNNIFSYRNGMQKSQFFSPMGYDNVHLNKSGISRLAKHLKYIAHNQER